MAETLEKLLQRFDADLARQDRSDITRRGYLADLHDYARWVEQTYGEAFNPREITRDDVRAYLSHLATVRRAKPATINRKRASLAAFCRWAMRAKLLKADPTIDIETPKQVKAPPKALARSDLNRLLRKVNQSGRPLHAAVIVTLANTGLRVGELVALTLSDVEIHPRSGTIKVRSGKGNKYREVPANADVRRAISEYVKVRPNAALPEHADRLFIGQRGEPLTPLGVWRTIDKYAKQARLDARHVSPHVLRHTFATLLLREHHVDLVTVADLLGHENVGTTMRYTRSTEADRRAAIESLGSA